MAHIAVVTGAGGFVASELVNQLLQKGYIVRATVRDASDSSKVKHLLALGEALPGTLELHKADLGNPAAFDSVVKGAHHVFHTATPNPASWPEDLAERQKLVDAAVLGTCSVIEAAAKSKDTIKRVIVTSSMSSIRSWWLSKKDGPWTEDDTNVASTLDKDPYPYSKVLAEREAWALADKLGISLVTIHPSYVMGPVLSHRGDSFSITVAKKWTEGTNTDWFASVVDVRDVARVHILAAERPGTYRRLLVSHSHTLPLKVLLDALAERFPEYEFWEGVKAPSGSADPPVHAIDNSRVLKEFDLELIDPRQSIVDMAVTMLQRGFCEPRRKSVS